SKRLDLRSRNNGTKENDSTGKALTASTKSLKKAGKLLLKAVQSVPENNPPLIEAADALITAHGLLVNVLQILADAGNISAPSCNLIPPVAERLRAIEYSLN